MIETVFKAYDVRAVYPSPLSEDVAWKVGRATAEYLKSAHRPTAAALGVKNTDTVVVGRDMRPSSPTLAGALIDGIRSTGLNVVDIGTIDTSMIYFAINHLSALGGIQTSCSTLAL